MGRGEHAVKQIDSGRSDAPSLRMSGLVRTSVTTDLETRVAFGRLPDRRDINYSVKPVHRSSRLIMTPRMTPSSAAHPVTISVSRQSPLAATSMAINGGAKKGPMLPT